MSTERYGGILNVQGEVWWLSSCIRMGVVAVKLLKNGYGGCLVA